MSYVMSINGRKIARVAANRVPQAIDDLAEAFAKGQYPKALYRAALESLARLAIAEHVVEPIRAAQADMERVAEIQMASRQAQ